MILLKKLLVGVSFFSLAPAFSFAYDIPSADRAALTALLGSERVEKLKLSELSKEGRSLTLLRSEIADGEASGGKDSAIADSRSLYFCNAYIEIMTQVVLDEKPALVHVYHRQPSENAKKNASGLYYDWKHIVRAFHGQTITSPAERDKAKEAGIIATQSVKINQQTIKDFGAAKHQKLVAACESSRGRYKSLERDKAEEQRYKAVIDKLGQLGHSGRPGSRDTSNPHGMH